jgi:hypothetical protein
VFLSVVYSVVDAQEKEEQADFSELFDLFPAQVDPYMEVKQDKHFQTYICAGESCPESFQAVLNMSLHQLRNFNLGKADWIRGTRPTHRVLKRNIPIHLFHLPLVQELGAAGETPDELAAAIAALEQQLGEAVKEEEAAEEGADAAPKEGAAAAVVAAVVKKEEKNDGE